MMFNFIMSLLWAALLAFVWVFYFCCPGKLPLWYVIFVTIWAVMHIIFYYFAIKEDITRARKRNREP